MKKVFFICCIAILLMSCTQNKETKSIENIPNKTLGWNYIDTIRANCKPPLIPTDTFYLQEVSPEASPFQIQKAIDAVADHGGGTLIVDSGIYNSGPIVLKSNIELHLNVGAYVKFIPETVLYPLQYTWFSGRPCLNFSSMVYARNQSNIKISGQGILDGQGNHPTWKTMKYYENADFDLLRKLDENDVKVVNRKFGEGHSLRPDLLAFYQCENLAIEGVTLLNTPYSAFHPVLSKKINFLNCTIKSRGYNQIGLAIESSQEVCVEDVKIEDIGEGIKFLAGAAEIAENRPTKNVLIQNCTFKNVSYTPLIFSSKAVKGIEQVFVDNINIQNSQDGICIYGQENSHVYNLFMRNIEAKKISGAFFYCRILRAQTNTPIIEKVLLEDIVVQNCGRAMLLMGNDKCPIRNIQLRNADLQVAKNSFATHVTKFTLTNVNVNGTQRSQTLNLAANKIPKINLEGPEEEILDMGDIQYNDLPVAVKETLDKTYPYVPVLDIDRIITSTSVSYEIQLEMEAFQRLTILIQADGELIRREFEIDYPELPGPVVDQMEKYLDTHPGPYLFNDIKEISYRDFNYYELKGEWNKKLFVVGISADGKMIEDKQQNIRSMLPF